ncbi:MAG: hypothetical protein GEU82_08940, partial [Luteitalea sp.]|nr:hypothetical protein [Luteitalea sp.]
MRKKAALICGVAVAAAVGAYWFSGFRITLDGSGMWPRFFSRSPDYDALEADRAAQRRRVPEAATTVSGTAQGLPAAPAAAPAATPAPATA